MAEVNEVAMPSAGDQYRALLQLRLILFRRGVRSSGGKFAAVLRVFFQLLIVCVGLVWGVLAGFFTFWALSADQVSLARGLFFGFSVVWQLLVVLRSSVQHEVGRNLLRFPLRLRTYVTLWTLSGLLGFTTIAGALICIGIFVGAVLAGSPYIVSLLVAALLFAFNFILSRVLSAYLERLLAHRRTREVFLIVFSLVGLVPQLIRMYGVSIIRYIPAPVRRAAQYTPPPMLLRSVLPNASAYQRWSGIGITALITALLSALLLYRLLQEYRGEDLHESVAGQRDKSKAKVQAQYVEKNSAWSGSVTAAVFANEISKLRHSGSALYQTVAPLIFVVLFGVRMAARAPSLLLPFGVMYLSLNLVARTGNSLGDDGAGAQLYSLAPVRFRDVMIAKNLFAISMFGLQLLALLGISLAVGVPKFWYATYALLFAIFTIAVNLWVGNISSIKSATRVDFSKATLQSMRAQRRGAGRSWRLLLMMFGIPVIGAGIGFLGFWLHTLWLPSAIMLVLAAISVAIYLSRLNRFDTMTIAEMEPALSALTKTA